MPSTKQKLAGKLIIFQNYYTPYRAKLFAEIAKEVPLTVVYFHKPEDEGRKWKQETTPAYQQLDLPYKKVGPFIWTDTKSLTPLLKPQDHLIALDNLPTNLSMYRILSRARTIISPAHIAIWEEHIVAPGSDPFLKIVYRRLFSWILAYFGNTLFSFSKMTSAYLKKVGLPLKGQDIIRTYQTAYTESELAAYFDTSIKPKSNKEHNLTFGFLGYFTERKGIRELLLAISYYKNDNATFEFAGDGPARKSIEAAAEKDPRISLVPYVSGEEAKTKFFRSIDVLVVPSERDPWGLVVNEAAARGVPSLVSAFVGAQELVEQIDSKLFVMRDNRAVSIARSLVAIEKAHHTNETWQEIRTKTLKASARFTSERAAEPFIVFYSGKQ